MSVTWDTKWGKRRVRQDPPTLAEAVDAAQGLTDDHDHQIEIAATLMGLDTAIVRAEAKKLMAERRAVLTIVTPTRFNGPRTVVVERKTSRRLAVEPTRRASTLASLGPRSR